jgi:hypothetical protein
MELGNHVNFPAVNFGYYFKSSHAQGLPEGLLFYHLDLLAFFHQALKGRVAEGIPLRPVLVALGSALLGKSAHRHNKSDILLDDHPPEVVHRVVLRTLSRNEFPIQTHRAVHKVGIDVGIGLGQASFLVKDDSSVVD